MSSFEVDKELLKVFCFERPEDNKNWWECDITKEELQQLESNQVSCFDLMNDGREVW